MTNAASLSRLEDTSHKRKTEIIAFIHSLTHSLNVFLYLHPDVGALRSGVGWMERGVRESIYCQLPWGSEGKKKCKGGCVIQGRHFWLWESSGSFYTLFLTGSPHSTHLSHSLLSCAMEKILAAAFWWWWCHDESACCMQNVRLEFGTGRALHKHIYY